jgi:hypothetical protein
MGARPKLAAYMQAVVNSELYSCLEYSFQGEDAEVRVELIPELKAKVRRTL